MIFRDEVICWDLDSTVRRTVHRRGIIKDIEAGEATWDDYGLACSGDEPIEGAVTLMRILSGVYLNFAVSFAGGGKAAESLTYNWCLEHDVPLDQIIMPPAGTHGMDKHRGIEFKVGALLKLQGDFDVRLYFEDYGPIAVAVRERTGIPVLGVNPFDDLHGLLA